MADKRPDGSRKGGRKVRIDFRKNRGKTARDKRELTRQYHEGDPEIEDLNQAESVKAKGSLSRKRTIIVRDSDHTDVELRGGRVVALRGLIAEVDDGEQVFACTVRRVLRTRLIKERHPIAVGDAVKFRPSEVGGETGKAVSASTELPEGVIEVVEPRETTLERSYERRVQVVAANIDTAVIVVAADQPTLRPHLIDRYLVSVHRGEMRPIVCINKMDLDAEGFAAEVLSRYERIGYVAIGTSVMTPCGLDELREVLQDKTSVLAGPSGVGKSSLLNALDPNLRLEVGTLSDLQRGRHTTTTARLLKWVFGGYVVDTPGIRQFDLAQLEPEEVEAYFAEFVDLVASCKFEDCTHTHEKDCAIKAAVETGDIHDERYDSYCRIFEECVQKHRDRH